MAVKEASATALLQMKAVHADDLATSKMNSKSVIQDQQLLLQISKIKYKSTIQEQQHRHAEKIEKQMDEMNSLREYIYGQNDMIDGCVEENRDKRKKSWLASKLVTPKEDLALSSLEKMKLWKTKCKELNAC
jgi:hypothetical protein